jgi:haloalkane dehalogenase
MYTEGDAGAGAANVHSRKHGRGPAIVFLHGFPLSGQTWDAVARELALIDRERVSHLVLTNTEIQGHRPPWIPTCQALANVPGFGAVLRRLVGSRAFLRSPLAFGGCFHDPRRIDGAFRERYIEALVKPGTALDGVLRFLRRMKCSRLDEFSGLHAQLTMPTLFIWGADDPTFPEPLAREMSTQLPNVAGFHSVPNAKLFFHEEHPVEVAARIAGLLAARQ